MTRREAAFIQVEGPCNPSGGQHHMAQQGGVFLPCTGKAGNGFARNQQQVFRSLGADVPEADALFILVHDVRRDFPGTDFFK